jgi:hypothetical protein
MLFIIENWTVAELERFAVTFGINIPQQINGQNISKARKANIILETLSLNELAGPFSDNIQIDSVQYIFEKITREMPPQAAHNNIDFFGSVHIEEENESLEQYFIRLCPRLYNSIKRDGYTINNEIVTPLLPEELITGNVENELFRLLDSNGFAIAKGHLEQAIENHSNGNWAAANGQFRTFMESLLISISNQLIPNRICAGFSNAIQWLSNPAILNPVFLSPLLNEVSSPICDKPYINGLWKRLHPTGSHPGLSDDEDSTFRYHTLIVFARYLLNRLETRI